MMIYHLFIKEVIIFSFYFLITLSPQHDDVYLWFLKILLLHIEEIGVWNIKDPVAEIWGLENIWEINVGGIVLGLYLGLEIIWRIVVFPQPRALELFLGHLRVIQGVSLHLHGVPAQFLGPQGAVQGADYLLLEVREQSRGTRKEQEWIRFREQLFNPIEEIQAVQTREGVYTREPRLWSDGATGEMVLRD